MNYIVNSLGGKGEEARGNCCDLLVGGGGQVRKPSPLADLAYIVIIIIIIVSRAD